MGSILTVILVGLAFGAVQLAAGLMIGHSLARRRRCVPSPEVEQLRQFARQLHRLTASVAEDVEGHQLEIGEASDELDAVQRDGNGLAQTVITTVHRVIHINRRLQQRLCVAEGKLQQQTRQIESSLLAAHTDALTGLLNRRVRCRSRTPGRSAAAQRRAFLPAGTRHRFLQADQRPVWACCGRRSAEDAGADSGRGN